MFKATATGSIKAVGFYSVASSLAYEISIYTNCTAGKPQSGTKFATVKKGTIAGMGFYTIPLGYYVPITKGKTFSVIVKFTTKGYNYPLPIEYKLTGYSSKATALSGQSYAATNGTTWSGIEGPQLGLDEQLHQGLHQVLSGVRIRERAFRKGGNPLGFPPFLLDGISSSRQASGTRKIIRPDLTRAAVLSYSNRERGKFRAGRRPRQEAFAAREHVLESQGGRHDAGSPPPIRRDRGPGLRRGVRRRTAIE